MNSVIDKHAQILSGWYQVYGLPAHKNDVDQKSLGWPIDPPLTILTWRGRGSCSPKRVINKARRLIEYTALHAAVCGRLWLQLRLYVRRRIFARVGLCACRRPRTCGTNTKHFFRNPKKNKFLSFASPITQPVALSLFEERRVRLLSIFVGQSLYLFEVRPLSSNGFEKNTCVFFARLPRGGW